MKTEVVKRTFEAENFPKFSDERNKLNENSITSEYMHGTKYLAFVHYPETATHNAYSREKGFTTKREAEEWCKEKEAQP